MGKSDLICGFRVLFCLVMAIATTTVNAELYINEIFSDPGGAGDDAQDAYIELRGTPELSLANHYLIFIENEGNLSNTGLTGTIDNIFVLGDDPETPAVEEPFALGTNGFLTFRQDSNTYADPALGTTDLVNTAGTPGWGSTTGGGSSVRARDIGDQGELEGSGFTAMLILDTTGVTPPTLGFDLDEGNDGLDLPTGREGWEIVDSIGFFGEAGEAVLGRLYGKVNFGPEIAGEGVDIGLPNPVIFDPSIEPDAVYVGLGYEIEYIGRWGDSTGQTADDWHASNLTDNALSGSTGVPDYRQSGGFHDPSEFSDRVETSQGVSYGTELVNTLGASNLFIQDGDFDFDGDVDGQDFFIWQENFGFGTGLTADSPVTALREHGDSNGDWVVNGLDLSDWSAQYSADASAPALGSQVVPEPGTIGLVSIGIFVLSLGRRGSTR